ncbi:hypothetical protein [Corynebacterium suedekumii]|uniref:Uncharacterized protein n=1 Tax=Corynebacterium suedekumii TaxID=3049801 RepID=A0ABY8VR12_9CORY|nr:hypothetical protein [Corynebacterium suedekumii]WIM71512.1 hypothetical protein QP029_07060 [Corynebacterium suedekumii]
MNTDNRRVYIFITIGLIAAVIVGVAVWRAGTPVTPSASDTATQTPEVSTVSEASRTSTTIRPTEETDTEQQAQAVVSPEVDDPYLAPNAVVRAAPQTIEPTVAYRPENVTPYVGGDTPATSEPTEPGSSDGQLPQRAPGTPETETDQPTETTPAEPTGPTEPSAPSEPSAPTDPTTPLIPEETVLPGLTPETAAPDDQPTVASLLTTPDDDTSPAPTQEVEAPADTPAEAATSQPAEPSEPQRAQAGPLRFWPFSSWLS